MLLFFVVTYFEGAVQWTGVLVLLRFRRAGSESSKKKEELVQKKGSKVPGLLWYVFVCIAMFLMNVPSLLFMFMCAIYTVKMKSPFASLKSHG
jgi:hypothetical protein